MTAPWEHRHPEGWRIAPLSTVVRETRARNKGLIEKNLLSLSYGSIVRRDIGSADGLVPASYETYQIVEPGQVVLRMTDLQNDMRSLRSGAVAERGIITSAYIAIEPVGVMPAYLAWLLRGYDHMKVFYSFGGGVRQSLTFADLKRLPTMLPPEGTQRRIADYLDRETATIDALIEKQCDLVRGLRQRAVALRDAIFGGRVGFGERLKWSVQEIDDRAGQARSDWDVLSVSIAWGVSRKAEREVHQAASEDTSHYKIVWPGDIVINRMRAFQGGLGCSHSRGLTSPDYGVLRARNSNVDPHWVAAVMKTEVFVGEMVSRLRGIGTVDGSSVRTPRVSLSDICEIRVFVPPLEVQRADVTRFEYENAQIDALIAKAERFIELAQERRAALITAAVTGQIEIPTED